MVFGQCRSVAGGTWIEPGGSAGNRTYTLSQNVSTGMITGTTYRAICQTPTWQVSGQFQGSGGFTLTATNPTPSDPVCTADWFTLEMTLLGPGCERADGTSTNNDGHIGVITGEYEWNKPCDIPSGESVSPSVWGALSPTRTHHGWLQILSAANPEINFGGRVVGEEFPSNGADGCYFAGSIFDPQTKPDPGAWTVGAVDMIPNSTLNIWGRDYVGWDEDAASYYQVERLTRGLPLACDFTVTQRMNIACNAGPTFYKSGVLRMYIDVTTVGSQRHGVYTSREWP